MAQDTATYNLLTVRIDGRNLSKIKVKAVYKSQPLHRSSYSYCKRTKQKERKKKRFQLRRRIKSNPSSTIHRCISYRRNRELCSQYQHNCRTKGMALWVSRKQGRWWIAIYWKKMKMKEKKTFGRWLTYFPSLPQQQQQQQHESCSFFFLFWGGLCLAFDDSETSNKN